MYQISLGRHDSPCAVNHFPDERITVNKRGQSKNLQIREILPLAPVLVDVVGIAILQSA